MNHRYYVQRLTEQIFLVRERLLADGAPGANDRIIRSFHILHDASLYAKSMNNVPSALQRGAVPERDPQAEKFLPRT
ncbi:MAG TPA: hypothetical protein VFN35_18230 [Ktedonobacteraceae bacterium]|nr:hypothetical protein [Ktedonobacteraceae bacterium]